ncbi:phosphoribosylglycinamide formyltransferase [Virgibacillus sp. 179-BFC.A HS]|uniref:Phosphoribosylglycinamide formyltransferase n=1 Tax=Tigheibacillus jepli TaxID=3035914 RepID=A0ABU5CJY5_9BACI|nr:phosphoribosylglycinamide formyltransferase [Virgibacillus sp. 179-BFC.A HS]MDY0406629.1 phosphoribosylglycinamide formyltransferase [Virgibacillus sp. 179-BFC.A HS]
MGNVKAAVFASGTGSNFQALLESESLAADIVLLVCDRPGAMVIEKAKAYGIPVFVADRKMFADKAAFELDILRQLQLHKVEWIFLAGYMRLIGNTLLNAFPSRIVNIHPSLLPAFPGKDAIAQALQAGVKVTGVTVHYIDAGMDTGPIIAQEAVSVETGDSLSELTERIHQVEHRLYPKTINHLLVQH